ncbi:MAG TPA: hypothetical protein VEW71_08590 [Allosphingosinicella sp.]|nr:hypothetical protein [Allosphingosinicella sp.]
MADPRLAALALTLLIGAAEPARPAPAAADGAGNRMVPFPAVAPVPPEDSNRSARHCTSDRALCAVLRRDGEEAPWRLELSGRAGPARGFALPDQPGEREQLALWPHLVREAGGAVLIGIERTQRAWMSGGGGHAVRLRLARAQTGAAALESVLDAPIEGGAMIRACFAESDQRTRAGACHDEYELAGSLRLDPATREGRPRFLLTARARTFPGRRSRLEDSQESRRLRRSDLFWWNDPVCTYRRTFAFDAATARYAPDRALPDCGEYLDF